MLKVLSIDGGGEKGLISAYILKDIETLLQQEGIADKLPKFDLYAGTSAGSIIASALAINKTPAKIAALLEKLSSKIFPKKNKTWVAFKELFKSSYSQKNLFNIICSEFDNLTLEDVYTKFQSRLVIPVTIIDPVRTLILKTPHIDTENENKQITLSDAIAASASAPLFFDPHSFFMNSDNTLNKSIVTAADGGLYASNPSLIAITETRKYLSNNKLDKIKLLSIANVASNISYSNFCKNWGLLTGWKGTELINTMLHLQSQHVNELVSLNLLEKNYLRLEATDVDCSNLALDCSIDKYKDIFRTISQQAVSLQKNKILDFFKNSD